MKVRKSFTLVKLLVVVAIIAVVLALPSVVRADGFTFTDQSGLSMTLSPTGQITDLRVGGTSLLNPSAFSGIVINDMAPGPTNNLLANGSFESWPDGGWYLWAANYPSSSVTRVSSSPSAEDGSRCLKFTGSGEFEISKPLTSFAPYTTYTLTAWVYPSSTCDSVTVQAGLQDGTWNGMNNYFSLNTLVKGQWNKIQTTFTTGNPSSLGVDFLIWRGSTGYVAIDNIVVTAAGSAQVTGTMTPAAGGGAILTSAGNPLGLQVTAQISPLADHLAMTVTMTDVAGRDRAIRANVVLNLNDAGWIWCNDLNSNYTAELNVWNMNHGTYAGHAQSSYPFGAVATSGGTGLAIGWPMANPRFYTQSFTRQSGGIGNLVLYADLGLAPQTDKFPNSASFDVIFYAFDGRRQFRGALARYYQIYPDVFEYPLDKQGIWTLWLGAGVEDLARQAGALYDEQEFDRLSDLGASMLQRDDQWGFLSMQYTEPWGYWHPLPPGFKDQHTNPNITPQTYETVFDQSALYNYVAGDLSSAAPADRFPGTTRGQVAQAIMNTAAWRDPTGNWTCHLYTPGGFAWGTDRNGWDSIIMIANADPDLPHPNRWDIAWNAQVQYVANAGAAAGAHMDGVYLDSLLFFLGLDRMDFCRDHWRVADIPLTYATMADGSVVPAQALILADVEYLRKLKSECDSRGWITQGNGFFPVYAVTAAGLDVLSAGEIGVNSDGTITTIDQATYGYFRTLAYRKPVSIMDYSLSLAGLDTTQTNVNNIVEPRINYDLFYGIYPGTANCWQNSPDTLARLNLVVPVLKKYAPIFQAINIAGWEPLTLAATDNSGVGIERWGHDVDKGLYFTLFNSTDGALSPQVTIDLTGLRINPGSRARELVSGAIYPLTVSGTGASFTPTIGSKRTIAVVIESGMTEMNDNLLTNGSFESGTANWYTYAANSPANSLVPVSSNPTPWDRQTCLKAAGMGFSEFSQAIRNVEPNTTYVLTARVYPSAGCPDGTLVQAGFEDFNMVNYYVGYGLTKGQWNEIKIRYTTGANAPALTADFMIWSGSADAAIAFDRINVEPLPVPRQNATMTIPDNSSIRIDGNLADWPAASAWSAPCIFWRGVGLSSNTQLKFAWNNAADLLYVAVQTNESSARAGGHLVIGVGVDKDSEAYTGIGATQLGFDFKVATGTVTVTNEISSYSTKYSAGWPGAGSGTTGVTAACRASGGVYTYEIAIPLWTNWLTMTEKKSLAVGDTVYVYAIMESTQDSGNGMNMTYNGNPNFAFENSFLAGSALTLWAASGTPGDANRDGLVSFEDFAILQNHYGQSATGDTWSQGDFNGDGQITFADFAILQNHYGQTGAAGSASAMDGIAGASEMPCAALGLVLLSLACLAFMPLRIRG